MKHVERSQFWAIPATNTLLSSIALLFQVLLLTSCGSSGGDTPEQPITPLGTNASLASLSIDGAAVLDPVFTPSVTGYSAMVKYQTSNTSVTATVEDASATISVNGVATTSGVASVSIALDVGSNAITITVTAEDRATTKTYSVSVMRQEASNNASLSSLALDGISLSPAFSDSATEYAAEVGFAKRDTNVVATAEDENATISVNGAAIDSGASSGPIPLEEGANFIAITVTAEDGFTTQSYTVTIDRRSASDFAQDVCIDGDNTFPLFGRSVALSSDGSTLAVAPSVFANRPSLYRVYIYSRDSAGVWSQPAVLETSGDYSTFFVHEVAISNDGSTLVVARRGIGVRVYSRDNPSVWSQQAYLEAPNAGDAFGESVALSDDGYTLAVGAPLEDSAAIGVNGDETDNSARDAGAVYVYTSDGIGTWTRQAYIKASNTGGRAVVPGDGDNFGRAIALSSDGTTLAVGAPNEASSAAGMNGDEEDNSAPYAGAVYVFTRDGDDGWSQQAYAKSLTTNPYFKFGNAVALSSEGTTLAAAEIGSAGGGGTVFILKRNTTGTWDHEAFLNASNGERTDEFGFDIAMSGDGNLLAVGAPQEDSASTEVNGDETDNSANDAGAGYVFTRDSGGLWTQRAYIKSLKSNIGSCQCEDLGSEAAGKKASRLVAQPVNPMAFSLGVQPTYPNCSDLPGFCYWQGMRLGESISTTADGTLLVFGAPFENYPRGTNCVFEL